MATWLLPEVRKDVSASDQTGTYWAFTPWRLAAGTTDVKCVVRLRQATEAEVEVQAAYQYAETDTDEPSSWALIPDTATSTENAAECSGIVDMTAESPSIRTVAYIRFGVRAKLTTADANTKAADVSLIMSGRD